MKQRSFYWLSPLYLVLALFLGCGGGAVEGGSEDSGISPYIQSETQADTGPDIVPNVLMIELASCSNAEPEFRYRTVRRIVRAAGITFIGDTWHIPAGADEFVAQRLREIAVHKDPSINWNVWGNRLVTMYFSFADGDLTVESQPNPACASPVPVF